MGDSVAQVHQGGQQPVEEHQPMPGTGPDRRWRGRSASPASWRACQRGPSSATSSARACPADHVRSQSTALTSSSVAR